MGILGSILLKYYRGRDFSSQQKKGVLWTAFVQTSKTNAIFGLGFFTRMDCKGSSDAALTSNSDEHTKKLMAQVDFVNESVEELKSSLESAMAMQMVLSIRSRSDRIRKSFDESTMAKVKSILESQIGIEKSGRFESKTAATHRKK